MRVYKNNAYEGRGFSWQPAEDPERHRQADPDLDEGQDPAEDGDSYDPYQHRRKCRRPCPPCPDPPYPPYPPFPPHPPCPKPRCPYPDPCDWWYPAPKPECYRYPVPEPVPCPYPVPCPRPEFGPLDAFGYFASATATDTPTTGLIHFTTEDEYNRNVELVAGDNTKVRLRRSGIYRIYYSVTATTAVSGVSLQLLLDSALVAISPIPILQGVNDNEIFLRVSKNDTLSLNLTGSVTLAAGKNASLVVQLIDR